MVQCVIMSKLEGVAKELVMYGKGILAADESTKTINKRFAAAGIPETEEMHRRYRELLFTTPDIEKYISGVILYDETIKQSGSDGVPFPELLSEKGVMPGIKVDQGAVDTTVLPGEKVTKGLEGLPKRISEYVSLGAKFAKWRAIITISGDTLPTHKAIEENARILAEYAEVCQEGGLVPILEPEVIMEGDHTLERCKHVTTHTLNAVFAEVQAHNVSLPELLLKINMILPGSNSDERADSETVARETVAVLRATVPSEVLGVVFLSGGQNPEQASANLDAIADLGKQPWELTFSYGRALHAPVLAAWAGKDESKAKAQEIFKERMRLNALASTGNYTAG